MIAILSGIALALLILLLVCNWDRVNWMESCAGQANLRIKEYNRAQEAEAVIDSIRPLLEDWMIAAAHDYMEGNTPSGIAYHDCAKTLERKLSVKDAGDVHDVLRRALDRTSPIVEEDDG